MIAAALCFLPLAQDAVHYLIPQRRALDPRASIQVERVEASIRILEETAATELLIQVRNGGGTAGEAVLLVPLPAGSAVSGFDFDGPGAEPSARLLPHDEARRTYEEIVGRLRDPALLEFAGYHLLRSSVFPVPAGGTQRVRVRYEHILSGDGDRVDYALPRSEALDAGVPWRIWAEVVSKDPISMVYSPSHELAAERRASGHFSVSVPAAAEAQPGPFLLSYLRERGGVSASLFAYPDPKIGGGYFLLMAGLPAAVTAGEPPMRREVTLVLDRSGSMAGGKLDQAKAAALQVLEGLEDGEFFNLIDYSTAVASFAPQPVAKTRASLLQARAYLEALRPNGGTNIHDALLEALRPPATPGALPLVLFLTDGLPTVGQTAESAIRKLVETGNPHQRRVFTFGVGTDVNAPLLDRLADVTRAAASYVLPQEDVEVKVAQVFRRLRGPVFRDLRLETLDPAGQPTTRAVRELIPERLPDLFDGDRLVLLGQYQGADPLNFRLSGQFCGSERSFSFRFELAAATTRNAFVPRLWASRRIAFLIDQVRQATADAVLGLHPQVDLLADARTRELVEEILRLSTEFGILSEYTAFLATEGTELHEWNGLLDACSAALEDRAARARTGAAGVNQALNFNEKKVQSWRDYSNGYWDEKLSRVEFSNVQQVCDRSFFRRDHCWIDAQVLQSAAPTQVDREVRLGSEEHRALLERLIGEGRQAIVSLSGDILIHIDRQNVLIRNQ